MAAINKPALAQPGAGDLADRLALANALYREFHTRCFWHCPRDLDITEELLPFVVKGLRTHGGRRGFVLAARLLPSSPPSSSESRACP